MERITSNQNPRIKHLANLQQKSGERRKNGTFAIEGQREIQRCIEAGYHIEALYVCPEVMESSAELGQTEWAAAMAAESNAEDFCRKKCPGSEIISVSRTVYEKIACRDGTEGVVAVAKSRPHTLSELEECLENTKENGGKPLIIVLESVEKPGNLGAIFRTADATGATAVVVCDPLTDFYNPNLIRSSLGAVFTVPCATATSAETIEWLKGKGIKILTAQLQDSELYYDTDMAQPAAIVMGTEATGLTAQWREAADAHIRIPMLGHCDSLNVSVSAAILLYESVRQRCNTPSGMRKTDASHKDMTS